MQYTIFLIAAYILGCFSAIPVGPVQIEVIRRAVNGRLKAAFTVIAGAFLIDLLYGSIAFFGIAPFLNNDAVRASFWFAGSIILAVLGVLGIRHSAVGRHNAEPPAYLMKKRWALLSGVTLSATNPVMILWWLTGASLFKDAGLIAEFNTEIALSFLAAGSLGLASYLAGLSLVIYWAKKFISDKTLERINIVFSILLLLLALYFLYTSCHTILRLC